MFFDKKVKPRIGVARQSQSELERIYQSNLAAKTAIESEKANVLQQCHELATSLIHKIPESGWTEWRTDRPEQMVCNLGRGDGIYCFGVTHTGELVEAFDNQLMWTRLKDFNADKWLRVAEKYESRLLDN